MYFAPVCVSISVYVCVLHSTIEAETIRIHRVKVREEVACDPKPRGQINRMRYGTKTRKQSPVKVHCGVTEYYITQSLDNLRPYEIQNQ